MTPLEWKIERHRVRTLDHHWNNLPQAQYTVRQSPIPTYRLVVRSATPIVDFWRSSRRDIGMRAIVDIRMIMRYNLMRYLYW